MTGPFWWLSLLNAPQRPKTRWEKLRDWWEWTARPLLFYFGLVFCLIGAGFLMGRCST